MLNCYLLTRFVYWKSQKIVKRKFDINLICYLTSHFGTNKAIFVFMVFWSMHVLDFIFWVRVIWINNEIGIIVWLGVIILQSPEKGDPWKFWLNPRFPRNSKSKWTLKWLPLDRGYFKFYFRKGKSILIILCHAYLLVRKFVISFQVIFVLPCILFSLKCHGIWHY